MKSSSSSDFSSSQNILWAEGTEGQGHLVSCLRAAGQWGLEWESELSSVPMAQPTIPMLHPGKPLANQYFLEREKGPMGFFFSISPSVTSADVSKQKHENILQRPKHPDRKFGPMLGPAY